VNGSCLSGISAQVFRLKGPAPHARLADAARRIPVLSVLPRMESSQAVWMKTVVEVDNPSRRS
jgi:hypothetical protein